MRKLLLFIVLSVLFQNCNDTNQDEKRLEEVQINRNEIKDIIRNPVTANAETDSINVAKMTFEKDTFFFGEVDEGAVINHKFKFTNTGNVPLLIHDARSTCGCTIPQWPKAPIQPGEGGVLKVKFDTDNKDGYQDKPVTVLANTYPNSTVVHVVGKVNKK